MGLLGPRVLGVDGCPPQPWLTSPHTWSLQPERGCGRESRQVIPRGRAMVGAGLHLVGGHGLPNRVYRPSALSTSDY